MAQFATKRPDGAELSISVDGDGPDLMLITGLSGTAGFWEPIVPALAKRFRVIRHDQRGVAKSTCGNAKVTVDLLAGDAVAVMDRVASKRPLILGHSMGGVVLQAMALQHADRMAGIILSGTWARPNPYMRELFRSRAEILKAAPQEYSAILAFLAYPPDWLDQHWPYYRAMIDNAPKTTAAQSVMVDRIAALLEFDRSKDVAGLKMPVAVQGAEDDLVVPAFLQRELAQLIPGAALSMLPNGGHFFPVTRPDGFMRTITAHAERIGHVTY